MKNAINQIRKGYIKDLKSEKTAVRQRATAIYFIDRFALRVGYKKKENEVDTVGCCTLRFEHIKLESSNIVHFDFPGKGSIRFKRTVKVKDQVYKNISFFKRKSKDEKDMLFNEINALKVNKYLSSYGKGLTAKVFRTYNASFMFQLLLKKHTPVKGSKGEKISVYKRANREVAHKLNHKRTAGKPRSFGNQMNSKGNNKRNKKRKEYIKKNPSSSVKTTRELIKETNTQSSRLYYIDPRISVAWCLKYDVPFDRILKKNTPDWAMKVDKDWRF